VRDRLDDTVSRGETLGGVMLVERLRPSHRRADRPATPGVAELDRRHGTHVFQESVMRR